MNRIIRSNSESNLLAYKKIIDTQNNNLQKLKIIPVNKEFNKLRRKLTVEQTDKNVLESNTLYKLFIAFLHFL